MNNELTANPFSGQAARTNSSNAVAQTDQQRAIAEVRAAMVIARSNPRDPVAAMDRILNACTRPTLADAAVYQYAKGGSNVSGPSIRLAEAMAQQWGNIKTSVRELEQINGVSTVQTIAWDLETGYQCDKVFQVPHLRYTRNGSKKLEDPRDIYELVANQGSRRLRACILAVIPGDVTEAAVTQCEVTMRARADTSPEAMAKMVDAFKAFGVSREQIEKRIQRRMDAIQPAQVVALKKVYASLREAMSSPADWFEMIDGEAIPPSDPVASDELMAAAKSAAAQGKASFAKFWNVTPKEIRPQLRHIRAELDRTAAAFDQARTVEPAPAKTPSSEPVMDASPKQPEKKTFEEVMAMLAAAKNLDALSVAGDWIGELDEVEDRRTAQSKFEECRFVLEME